MREREKIPSKTRDRSAQLSVLANGEKDKRESKYLGAVPQQSAWGFAGLNIEMKPKCGRFPCRDNRHEERRAEGKSAGGNGRHVSMKEEMDRPTLLRAEAPLKSGPFPLKELCLG